MHSLFTIHGLKRQLPLLACASLIPGNAFSICGDIERRFTGSMLEDFLDLIQNGIGAKRLGNKGKGMIP